MTTHARSQFTITSNHAERGLTTATTWSLAGGRCGLEHEGQRRGAGLPTVRDQVQAVRLVVSVGARRLLYYPASSDVTNWRLNDHNHRWVDEQWHEMEEKAKQLEQVLSDRLTQTHTA